MTGRKRNHRRQLTSFPAISNIEPLERRLHLSAGDLDPSFHTNGKLVVVPAAHQSTPNDVAVQADGKIVVVGSKGLEGAQDFYVARYNADGTPDDTFGGGTVVTDMGGDDVPYHVAIDSQGRIVVSGTGGAGKDFAVARYTTSGVLDTQFNSTGKRLIDFGATDIAKALVLTAQDQIVVAGDSTLGDGTPVESLPLAKITAAGALDTTFSGDGKEQLIYVEDELDLNNKAYTVSDLSLDSNGRILVAGDFRTDDTTHTFAARLVSDGSFDSSFGISGVFDPHSDDAHATAIIEAATGVLILTTTRDIGPDTVNTNWLITNNGIDSTDFNLGPSVVADILKQPDGRLIFAGYSPPFSGELGTSDFEIYRTNRIDPADPSVALDQSFGSNGRVFTDFASTFTADDRLAAVAVDFLGHIVAVGQTDLGGGLNTAIAHYDGGPFIDANRVLNIGGTSFRDKIIITDTGGDSINVIVNLGIADYLRSTFDSIVVKGYGAPDKLTLDAPTSNLRIQLLGMNGNDTLTSNLPNSYLDGGDGADIILGSNGKDTIFGGAGDDVINARSGNDKIHGGDGNDTIVGGKGHDRLYGDSGDDQLLDRDHYRDTLYGSDGTDEALVDNSTIKDLWSEIETLL